MNKTLKRFALLGGKWFAFGILGASLTCASADTAIKPPAGMVAWWPGNGNAQEIINGLDGRPGSGISFAGGKVGRCFQFDGTTNDFMWTGGRILTNIRDNFTIEFWAYPTASRAVTPEKASGISGANKQRFVVIPTHGGNNGPAGMGISVGNNGVSVFELAGNYFPSVLVHNASINGWTHIAVVYDGKLPMLYLNGKLAHVGLLSPRSWVFPSIGFGANDARGAFQGLVDEIAIYDRVLTGVEIQSLYAAGSAGKAMPPNHLMLQPPFGVVYSKQAATFSVTADGAPPFQYQWFTNKTAVPLATNSTYTLSSIGRDDLIKVGVIVSNVSGTATSETVPALSVPKLWMEPLPRIVSEFKNNNDAESAAFVDEMVKSLNAQENLTHEAALTQLNKVQQRVTELVQRGAVESAAILNGFIGNVATADVDSDGGISTIRNHPTNAPTGPGGLVLYLPFDEPDKDGVVRDASGAGNHGRVSGAQWVSDGKFGGAYQFSLSHLTDKIVVPDSDSLNPESVTVCAWIKTTDQDGFWNRVVDKDGWTAYCLCLGGGMKDWGLRGKLAMQILQPNHLFSDQVVGDGGWHHVAVLFNGSGMACFVDGVGKSESAKLNAPLIGNQTDLCIGNSLVKHGVLEFAPFDGLIDEVRIYNRALSAAEIKNLATATEAGVNAANPAPPPSAKPSSEDRLKQAKSLFDQGLIDKETYDKKVKEIMDAL